MRAVSAYAVTLGKTHQIFNLRSNHNFIEINKVSRLYIKRTGKVVKCHFDIGERVKEK